MNTTRYLFQSPYNSQVQFGRPDPSSQNEQKTQSNLNAMNNTSDAKVQEAQSFEQTQKTEVTPKVESANILDIYA